MKKLTKTLALALAIILLTGGVGATYADAAGIYFAGKYCTSDGACICLNQYSSPEGKNVGNFQIGIPHFYKTYEGELIKIGTNKYRSGKKGLTFKVYKKKVIVTVSGKKYDKALKGTYKLKKRYPRP